MVIKKLLIACGILMFSSCHSKMVSVQKGAPELIVVDKGYQLNYNLASGGERYQFIVEVKEMKPNINFDYTLSMKKPVKGNMTLTQKAREEARYMRNYFSKGKHVLPDSMLTVWLSRSIYQDLVSTGKCKLSDGESYGKLEAYQLLGYEKFNTEINGEPVVLDVLRIKGLEGKKSEFLILKNPTNPLIIKMNVGWEISLKEIFHN